MTIDVCFRDSNRPNRTGERLRSLSVCGGAVSALAVGIALMALPKTAAAEEQAASSSLLPEIIITSQFRAENVQDTPIAITAVNAAMIEARGQSNIYELAAQAPNVSLRPQPQNSGIGLVAFIRGVGQTDFNYALEPGVGVYVDDVYIPTLSSSLIDLMDLDRVEILRGPQGTLAGKNSIGGAIKLFTAKPMGSDTGSVQATYGSYNRIDVKGMADFAITDNLAARITGASKGTDGYIRVLDYGLTHPGSNVPSNNAAGKSPGVLGTLGGVSTQAARMALRWTPTSSVEINISGDYTRERNDSGAEVLLAGVDALSPTTRASFLANNPNVLLGTNADGRATTGDPADGGAWLTGLDGTAIPIDCRFVPFGPNSCDTGKSAAIAKYNSKYINYSNFLDGMTPTTQAPYKPYAAIPGNDFNGWGLMSNVRVDLAESLQLTWISSWREYDSTWGMDQDGSPVPEAQLNQTLHHRAWSQEVRLNGDFADKKVEYTVGGFWFDQDGTLNARVDLNYAGIDFIHGPDTTPSTSKAAFLNTTFHATDRWSISGGVRYSKDKKTYTYFRSNPDGTVPFVDIPPMGPPICESFYGAGPVLIDPTTGNPVPGPVPVPTATGNTPNCLLTGLYNLSDSFKGSRWDWRAVTNYRVSDELMVYASASTGYKGGGVNPRPFFGPSAGECPPLSSVPRDANGNIIPTAPCNQLRPFNPESLTTYEVGFKADVLDNRLRLNGAAFYNRYKNIILTLSACPSSPCIQPRNIGKANVKGLELETTFYPIENFSVDGSISYLDFQYKDTGDSGLQLTAITPLTPELTYSFGLQYDVPLMSASKMSFRFDGSYTSHVFAEAFNTPESRVDGYFLGNGRITYTGDEEKWQVALEVQNIFDKYYFLTKSDITKSLGLITAQPGMPRTWAVSVKRNF